MAEMPMTRPPMPPSRLRTSPESMAFLVLGMADTEESRQALAGALTDGELSAMKPASRLAARHSRYRNLGLG